MISNLEVVYSKLRMFSYKPAASVELESSSDDILAAIKGAIDAICSDQSPFAPSDDVKLSLVRRRADVILTLRSIKHDLDTLTKFVDNKLEIASSLYSHEMSAMNKFIHSRLPDNNNTVPRFNPFAITTAKSDHANRSSSQGSHTQYSIDDGGSHDRSGVDLIRGDCVTRKTTVGPPGLSSLVERPCSLLYNAALGIGQTTQPIAITPALSLNATIVADPAHCCEENRLYYIPATNHFVFKLFGHVFHGNIGTIYTSETYTPEKIKDCKFALNCTKGSKCDYYHDPLKFHGSRDVRNFIASSWLYSPFNRGGRVFGSRPNLDLDILKVTQDDLSRLQDQLAHDFLCLMLLWSAMGESNTDN